MNNTQWTSKISRTPRVFIGIGLILVGGVIGGITPMYLPEVYEVSLTLEIQKDKDRSNNYYTYDGFYAIQSEELISDNVARWFVSPGFVERIILNSEPEKKEDISLRDLRKIFQAEQLSGSLVEIRFGVSSRDLGIKRSEAIQQVVTERVEQSQQKDYQIEVSEEVIRLKSYTQAFWIIGGLGFGLILSIVAYIIMVYQSKQR